MVFQIRAKVSREPIENGPANSAVYESEQVSFLFSFFINIMEKFGPTILKQDVIYLYPSLKIL